MKQGLSLVVQARDQCERWASIIRVVQRNAQFSDVFVLDADVNVLVHKSAIRRLAKLLELCHLGGCDVDAGMLMINHIFRTGNWRKFHSKLTKILFYHFDYKIKNILVNTCFRVDCSYIHFSTK